MADWVMSPQAHRRLLRTMSKSELQDLTVEIVRNLCSEEIVLNAERFAASDIIYNILTKDY